MKGNKSEIIIDMENLKKIRILIVGLNDKVGGIETLFWGLFKKENLHFQLSFLVFGNHCAFEDEFLLCGYTIYKIPTRKSAPLNFSKYVRDFFKSNSDFDYIWVNTSSTSMYEVQYFGKKYTSAKVITHSHGTTFDNSSGKIYYYINKVLSLINYKRVINNTDLFFCCSIAAGVALFGKKYEDRLILIKNGISMVKTEQTVTAKTAMLLQF